MTTPMIPSDDGGPPTSFIAIIDVDDAVGQSILEELTREGIAAFAEPLAPTVDQGQTLDDSQIPGEGRDSDGDQDPRTADVRIHVDRTRVPVARAIITSRLPQAGSRFLAPRDTIAPSLSTEQVDEAWAQLIRGWEPDDDQDEQDDRDPGPHDRRLGGSGLSERLIRRHGPASTDPHNPGETAEPSESATGLGSGPRDYAGGYDPLDDDDADTERFVPPEPPPLPIPRHTLDIVGWSAVIGGPVVLVANQVLAWGSWLSGVGVAAFMGGFVVLVARMRGDRDHDDPGAVV